MTIIKEIQFGIWDNHCDDMVHEFGCDDSLITIIERLAKMKLHSALDYMRYEIAVIATHKDHTDDEVNCVASFRIDPQYLAFVEGKK
jgi:hypothetical protein